MNQQMKHMFSLVLWSLFYLEHRKGRSYGNYIVTETKKIMEFDEEKPWSWKQERNLPTRLEQKT